MLAELVKTSDRNVQISLAVFQRLLDDYHPRDFAVRFWDGSIWEAEPHQPTNFTLVLQHPAALRKMLWPPGEMTLAEAYIYDDFDIEGDITSIFSLANYFLNLRFDLLDRLRIGRQLLHLLSNSRVRRGQQAAQLTGSRHSIQRDKQAVTYHYNVSNDFYKLWLDRHMVYSCAYFADPDEHLNTAQERKLDYICRKLRLQRGERLLDIGCGWGGLLIHAARHYGVEAVGITLSQPQVDKANARIREAGLSDLARAEVRDYRDIDEPEGFDKLVSVGMFEHVGEEMLSAYFEQAWRLLKPGGVFLNHGIANGYAIKDILPPRGPYFSERHAFPDAELVPLNTTLCVAESTGFDVRDVESLREHYALTLRNWVNRLEAHHDEALKFVDEVTYRVWRLNMAAGIYGFERGRTSVFQLLLAKPDHGDSKLPLMRADWYC